jgi:hypothetical protein
MENEELSTILNSQFWLFRHLRGWLRASTPRFGAAHGADAPPSEPASAVGESSSRCAGFQISVSCLRYSRVRDRYARRRGKAPQRGCRAGDPAREETLACPAVAAARYAQRRWVRFRRRPPTAPHGSSGDAPTPSAATRDRRLVVNATERAPAAPASGASGADRAASARRVTGASHRVKTSGGGAPSAAPALGCQRPPEFVAEATGAHAGGEGATRTASLPAAFPVAKPRPRICRGPRLERWLALRWSPSPADYHPRKCSMSLNSQFAICGSPIGCGASAGRARL